MNKTPTIELPESVKAEINRQSEVMPVMLAGDDKAEFLASVPVQFHSEAEDHLNDLADQDDKARWDFVMGSINTMTKLLREADLGRFSKPLLTIEEAADMLSISHKRLDNIICQERSRLGRSPDFIVDAGGRISRRVLRDELLSWAKRRGKNDRRRMVA